MLDRADAILKLALAFAVICLGCGVSYYYGIFLPMQGRETADRKADADKQRLAMEKAETQRKEAAAQAAHSKYDICLAGAQSDYSNRWDASCTRQHDSDLDAKQNCNSSILGDAYCASLQVRPATNCGLPTATADSYDAALQQAKQLCLDELKAGD